MTCRFQKFCPANSELCSKVQSPCDSKCYKAVMQAYKCVMSDEPEVVAMDAAIRVYRFHNPCDNKTLAHLTVERWVHDERVQ